MCQQTTKTARQCVICNRRLTGRSDKKFCDILCKNNYHSEVRRSMKSIRSELMNTLIKNYVLLNGLIGENHSACIIDKLALEKTGFRFNYITDIDNKNGIIHYGVFNLTYRFIHNKRVLITVDKERETISPYIFKRWQHELRETARA